MDKDPVKILETQKAQLERDVEYHLRMREYEKGALKDLAEFLGRPGETATDTTSRAISTILHLRQRNAVLLAQLQRVLKTLNEVNEYFDHLLR